MHRPHLFEYALALHRAGNLQAATAAYLQVLDEDANHPPSLRNLGLIYRAEGDLPRALGQFQLALSAAPTQPEFWLSYVDTLWALGEVDAVVLMLTQAEQRGIKDGGLASIATGVHALRSEPHVYLSLLIQKQQFIEAANLTKAHLRTCETDGEAWKILGVALTRLGDIAGAKQATSRAIEFLGADDVAHNNLGILCYTDNQMQDALWHFRRAIECNPDNAEARNNLGNVLLQLGLHHEAADNFRRSLATNAEQDLVHGNLLFLLGLDDSTDADSLFEEHLRFAQRFETPVLPIWPKHANDRDPLRPLRVGFVSADFNQHAVAHFALPVIEYLSKSPSLTLIAYYNNTLHDKITAHFQDLIPQWRDVAELDNGELSNLIQSDRVDILIDLNGHTAKNRLLTFARKPAPIQATWIGYPGTTGLTAMDYYFTDALHLPPGRFDHLFTEKLVYLPGSAPFTPRANPIPITPLPAIRNGYLTFGSFNSPSKIQAATMALWSSVLHALPTARLHIGAMHDNASQDDILSRFSSHGIDPARLTLSGRCGMEAYLAQYALVDVCLDTFPYNGGTTTLHSAWMGVPTVTLCGEKIVSRTGAVIMGHAGLTDFVAALPRDFVNICTTIEADLPHLAAIRQTLRDRLLSSPIGKPTEIGAALERALRTMWQRWCNGQPCVSFAATHSDDRPA